jgi:hypothetical protein
LQGKIGSDKRYRQSLSRYRRLQQAQPEVTEETPLVSS